MKSTNKDMMDSLFFWGVAKIYRYGVSVAAVDWNGVTYLSAHFQYKNLSDRYRGCVFGEVRLC